MTRESGSRRWLRRRLRRGIRGLGVSEVSGFSNDDDERYEIFYEIYREGGTGRSGNGYTHVAY
jgi:hypothetical protein